MNALVRFALVALYPRVDDLPGLAELDVDAKIAELRRDSTRLFWLGVVTAAILFQLAPILTLHRPWPAALLDEKDLDRHAHLLTTHRAYLIRQLIVMLKLVGGIFWGESPEIRAAMHLPPYPADPGTRRTGASVGRSALVPRAPSGVLVTLGRREEQRGRRVDPDDHEVGRVA